MVYHLDGMGCQVPSQWEIVSDENEMEKKLRQALRSHRRPTLLGSPTDLLDSDVLLVTAP